MSQNKPRIYLPAVPDLPSSLRAMGKMITDARYDLIEFLEEGGFSVPHILGQTTWVKNLGVLTDITDGVLFPPMGALLEREEAIKIKAQRFFEFVSVVTSMHVGDHRIYGSTGKSKPCVLIDTDGGWGSTIELLRDLRAKGAFSTEVSEIVSYIDGRKVPSGSGELPIKALNRLAVEALQLRFKENTGKHRKDVPREYPDNHVFEPFRKDFPRSRFGVVAFGSATMKVEKYIKAAEDFCEKIGQTGHRLITGAGRDSVMGAFDRGFHKGAVEFNRKNPDAPFKPAHIGISTNDVLGLEGPPPHLDQLLVVPTRNKRLIAFIDGVTNADPRKRADRTAKVACVFPGGIGSLEEFATMMQMKLHGKMMDDVEIQLCNIDGYYDSLIAICKDLGVGHLFKVFPDHNAMFRRIDEIHKEFLAKR